MYLDVYKTIYLSILSSFNLHKILLKFDNINFKGFDMKVLYFIILAIVTALLTGCEGSTSDHHQGVNCAQCHSGGENAFTSGASIFSTLNAGNSTEKSADNYSLRLVLAQSGSKINYSTGRGSGNAHATFNAGVARYTAQVVDAQGNVVNSSATNSHDSSRFDCNRCHTSSGVNGAPGRIVSFKYTRLAKSFAQNN